MPAVALLRVCLVTETCPRCYLRRLIKCRSSRRALVTIAGQERQLSLGIKNFTLRVHMPKDMPSGPALTRQLPHARGSGCWHCPVGRLLRGATLLSWQAAPPERIEQFIAGRAFCRGCPPWQHRQLTLAELFRRV